MADYLYAANPDSSYESADPNDEWFHSATGLNPTKSLDGSISYNIPTSWTTNSQQSPDSSRVFSSAIYQSEPDLSELIGQSDGGPSNPSQTRKGQLSHSRSFPGLHQQPHSYQQSTFRAGSLSLEIPHPGEFTAYSFEANLNPSSSLFSPSNLASQQFVQQANYHNLPQCHRSSTTGPQPISTFATNLRARSESEGSGSWAGTKTPMTPGDIRLTNGAYKSDLETYTGSVFGQTQLRLNNMPELGVTGQSASASMDQSFSSRVYSMLPQPNHVSSDSPDGNIQPSPAQHAFVSSVFTSSPTLENMRHTSVGCHTQNVNGSTGRQRFPEELKSSHPQICNSTLRKATPQSQCMSAGPTFSGSTSMETGSTNSSQPASATTTDMAQDFGHMYGWSQPPLSSMTLPSHVGQDLANLQLDISSHLSSAFMSPRELIPRAEREALLAPFLRLYLSSTNRFLLGERTVLVLSGKVAQKSYGAEKRFLCPPPSALLLGCSWWSAAETDPRLPIAVPNCFALRPPTTIISMSGEHSLPTEAYAEWMSMSGHVVGDQASLEDVVISGRCVGKQLHISEVDEKSKKVEALVRVIAPGFGPPEARHIGTFPSKPIKVISKPSKKRQSIKNLDLCIHHGTTIALFNRLRSQTVSTKYLCVSGPSASFPAGDWRAMSGMEEKPFATAEDATCFVARTSAWDPFIIYLVDPSKPASVSDPFSLSCPPLPGYPRAPSNALPLSPNGCPIPIYYNQPIVLQCLSTAVVSPVMVIRKVDKGSTATGGASIEGYASPSPHDMPVAPGEVLGDPVSQLHKIALEVMSDPHAAYMAPGVSPLAGFPGSGSFLACLGENVGVHRAESGRQAVPPLITPPSSASSVRSFGNSNHDALAEAAYLASQLTQPIVTIGNSRSRSLTPQSVADVDLGSCDGGKVKRGRKALTSGGHRSSHKTRKRTGSISSSSGFDDPGSESSDGSHAHSLFPHASKVWTIDCGEPAIWTIVGCDVERHTFWIPPVLIDGKPSSFISPGTVSDVFTTPIPMQPIGYDTSTPIPIVAKYLPPNPALADLQDLNMITIYGANLRPHLHVWFGDIPSPHVEYKCAEVVMAQPPSSILEGPRPISRQLILVSDDGIVFPTKVYFTGL
ncbi:hypothetical protein O181_034859 [Austropuccinia psidii MF-1]|uniref:LAG1-DNAbind-domain-containing protein n=1 Tax=Austropuccinia psidii MF-1 TaxID=1389203 RepID=A0A9Q3H9Z5_9BASI|nr:hypothetical protein [Austropuccinia psidii MF-1]